MTHHRHYGDLSFEMPCPYVDPETEQGCEATIQVRAWLGTPWNREDPGEDPGWDAAGCPHVEGIIDERTEYCIQSTVIAVEEDARTRAEEARIARAEEREILEGRLISKFLSQDKRA